MTTKTNISAKVFLLNKIITSSRKVCDKNSNRSISQSINKSTEGLSDFEAQLTDNTQTQLTLVTQLTSHQHCHCQVFKLCPCPQDFSVPFPNVLSWHFAVDTCTGVALEITFLFTPRKNLSEMTTTMMTMTKVFKVAYLYPAEFTVDIFGDFRAFSSH